MEPLPESANPGWPFPFTPRAFNMCGDFATPNLYAVSQQNCLQALYTRMTVMCRRSGSSSSNDDVERAARYGVCYGSLGKPHGLMTSHRLAPPQEFLG